MSKVTVRIDADEWYPVYSVSDDTYGLEVEATPEQIKRWEQARATFTAALDEMGELYEAARDIAQEQAKREKAEKEAAEKAERQRVAEERRKAAGERQKQEADMRAKIEESGGILYDADGKPVAAVVASGPTGIRLEPR